MQPRQEYKMFDLNKGTILKKASINGRHNVVDTLLRLDSEQISNSDKNIALWWATKNGHHQIVTAILKDYVKITNNEFQSAFKESTHPLVKQAFINSIIHNIEHKFKEIKKFLPQVLVSLVCEYVEHSSILSPEEFQQAISEASKETQSTKETGEKADPNTTVEAPLAIAFPPAPAFIPMAAPLLRPQPRRKRKTELELLQSEKPQALRRSARLAAKAK